MKGVFKRRISLFIVVVALFISIVENFIGIIFSNFYSFCFKPLHTLVMSLLEKRITLSVTLLPMCGPKFREILVLDSDGGFRSVIWLSLNVKLPVVKAHCSFHIFFGFHLVIGF